MQKKKKGKDDSDEDKKVKKEKKSKKDKKDKKDKKESNGNDKDYIKEALAGGKKEEDVFTAQISDDDASDGTETGVDDEGALALAVEATKKFLEDNSDWTVDKLVDIVSNQQMASALKSHDKVHILIRASFSDDVFKNKEIPKFAPAIAALTNGKKIMERHLIAALEAFCVEKPKNFVVMIKMLYDEDALTEDAILDWADEGRSEYTLDAVDEDSRALLRAEAEPVVVWLQDSDSEEESEED